jgi:integrase
MALGKQAKVLSTAQIDGVLGYIAKTRHPVRNRVIFLLPAKAGLRAKEIASLTWDMVTTSDDAISNAIHLRDSASKGRSGRIVPMNRKLRQALIDLRASKPRGVTR